MGELFTGAAAVTEFLLIAGGAGTVAAGSPVISRGTGVRVFALKLTSHKNYLPFICGQLPENSQ